MIPAAQEVVERHSPLAFLMWRRGAVVALVGRAYFDESGTGPDALDLCLAGYIFKASEVFAFDAAWREMLAAYGLPYFHMKECAHNSGVFGHLTRDQCDRAARRAIEIIQAHAAQGVAISVDKSVADGMRAGSIWQNPYSFIAGQVFHAVRGWVGRNEIAGNVACVFEAGADGVGQAVDAANKIMANPELQPLYRVVEFSTMLKGEATPLEAADMLAWHWLKYNRRQRQGIKEKRKDFRELLKVFTDAHHYDLSALEFLQAMRAQQV